MPLINPFHLKNWGFHKKTSVIKMSLAQAKNSFFFQILGNHSSLFLRHNNLQLIWVQQGMVSYKMLSERGNFSRVNGNSPSVSHCLTFWLFYHGCFFRSHHDFLTRWLVGTGAVTSLTLFMSVIDQTNQSVKTNNGYLAK